MTLKTSNTEKFASIDRVYGVGEHNRKKKFPFLFLNLDTVFSDLTQKISPTFDKLDEIK